MNMLRLRNLALVVGTIALAACRSTTGTGDSGVKGTVWVGPTCPVVQEGVDCPDAPLAADLEVHGALGRVVDRTRSGADGSYRIPLPAGEYTLVPLSPNEAGMPFASPVPLVIGDGQWTELDIYYDSGIR